MAGANSVRSQVLQVKPPEIVQLRAPGEMVFVGPPRVFPESAHVLLIRRPEAVRSVLGMLIGDQNNRAQLNILYNATSLECRVSMPPTDAQLLEKAAGWARADRLAVLRIPDVGYCSAIKTPQNSADVQSMMRSMGGEFAAGSNVVPSTNMDKPVVAWSQEERFSYVVHKAGSLLKGEAQKQFNDMMTPAAIGMMVGFFALLGAAYLAGGVPGAIITGALIAIGYVMVGWQIFSVARLIGQCLAKAAFANNISELDEAAHDFSEAIVMVGIAVITALLTHSVARIRGKIKAGNTTKPKIDEAALQKELQTAKPVQNVKPVRPKGVPEDLDNTLNRIKNGEKFPHRNDGSVFKNREGLLPDKPQGYYKEYVHPTDGVKGPGAQRVIIGDGGEIYYTPDHYGTFISL